MNWGGWEETGEEEDCSLTIDTHTFNPNAAKLAADEGAFLDSIHDSDDHLKQDELADWIGGILGEDLDPTTLFDDLNNGVRLLYLAKSIHLIKSSHLKDSEYKETVKNLQPDEFSFTDQLSPKRASIIAKQRSNIAKFLEWCRHIGVPLITIFETADLTQKKNLRQVTTCLLYVSRIAARFGIEPPSSVKEYMEKEEAKLLEKNMEEMKNSDRTHLILTEPPIYEKDEEALSASPAVKQIPLQLDIENYDRTSTPSSTTSDMKGEKEMDENLKPISPVELKFEEEDSKSSESPVGTEKTHFHFDRKPYIEDVEIRETPDMVIVDESKLRSLDVTSDNHVSNFENNSGVRISPMMPDENENTQVVSSSSFDSSSSSDENEYHTAQGTMSHEVTGIMYHTAFVDDVSDEELENTPGLVATHESLEETLDIPNPSLGEIPDISDMEPTSPYNLYRVPANIVVERHQDLEDSSDESTTDVESYVSNDVEREVTFIDVGIGTDDFILTPDDFVTKESEIMINFPPYFEIATKEEFEEIPPQQFIVAPVRNEPIYAAPNKTSRRQRSTHTNPAFEADSDSHSSRPSRDYASPGPRPARMHHQDSPSPTISAPTPMTRNIVETSQSEKGTQTHVSLTQDIVRIINELDDIPRLRTTSSSASSGRGYSVGTTVVVRTQYQRTLPASEREDAITQVSVLENSRPPRWGSVNSSTRHRSRDPEAVSGKTEVRRSVMRRASSAISEQFEKAVVAAKKYKKQITIVLVLLILTIGTLAAMLAVFPLT